MTFSPQDWFDLGVVLLLVGFSAFMALAETALTRVSRVKAHALVEQRRRGALRLAALVEQPSKYLNSVLLLTLLSQLVAATLVGVVADHLFGGVGVLVATIVEVLVIFVLGEAIPKNLAVVRPESSALFVAPIVSSLVRFWPVKMLATGVSGISRALTPGLSQLAGSVSEEELLAMADAAEEGDVIETEERALIHSVISFGDTVTREVMVPRPDIFAVEASTSVHRAIDLVVEVGRSRLPVFDGNIDNVVGIVMARDLLAIERQEAGGEAVGRHMRSAHFVPETKPVAELLREMKVGKFHIAVVVDEYGSTAGLVTLEDLIEELVGDIEDEYDTGVSPVTPLSDGSFEVRGTYSIDDLSELLGVSLPEGGWDTVGGFMLGLLGHLPVAGEMVEVAGFRFEVRHTVRHRVAIVLVRPVSIAGTGVSDATA
ncbi:MAG: hemolysin family protein [Ferrimicrobium sp.]